MVGAPPAGIWLKRNYNNETHLQHRNGLSYCMSY